MHVNFMSAFAGNKEALRYCRQQLAQAAAAAAAAAGAWGGADHGAVGLTAVRGAPVSRVIPAPPPKTWTPQSSTKNKVATPPAAAHPPPQPAAAARRRLALGAVRRIATASGVCSPLGVCSVFVRVCVYSVRCLCSPHGVCCVRLCVLCVQVWIEQRRIGLEDYLRAIVLAPRAKASRNPYFLEFLMLAPKMMPLVSHGAPTKPLPTNFNQTILI